jgi:hypothetical protein
MKTTDTKSPQSPRKASSQSAKAGSGILPKFHLPPAVLIFRELRRIELLQRRMFLGHLSHVD